MASLGKYMHTAYLRVEDSELRHIERVNQGWTVSFSTEGLTLDNTFTPEMNDKRKFWVTDELIQQLESWQACLEGSRNFYAEMTKTVSTVEQIYRIQVEIDLLEVILTDLREGHGIWED